MTDAARAERILAAIAYATCSDEHFHDATTSEVEFENAIVYMPTDDYEYVRSLVERFHPSGPITCRPVKCPDVVEITAGTAPEDPA